MCKNNVISKYLNISIGSKFQKLTILSYSHTTAKPRKKDNQSYFYHYYNCICDCGKECVKRIDYITKGRCISCGCFAKEKAYEIANKYLVTYSKTRSLDIDKQKDSAFNLIYQEYKNNVHKREFSITKKEFKELINKNCHYCNLPPSNKKTTKNKKGIYYYSGLDRVNTTGGYHLDNVVPCCKYCNTAKRDRKREDFIEWIKDIYNKTILQNEFIN